MYISIEGILGAGKTSILKRLEQELAVTKVKYIFESLQNFTHFQKHNPLECTYQDPSRNGPIAQLYIMDVLRDSFHSDNFTLEEKNQLILSDRSCLSPFAFICAQYHVGNYSAFVRDYLASKLFALQKRCIFPDYVIYLDISPNLATSRVQSRARPEEAQFSTQQMTDFQMCLQEAYHQLLSIYESQGKLIRLGICSHTSLAEIIASAKYHIEDLVQKEKVIIHEENVMGGC